MACSHRTGRGNLGNPAGSLNKQAGRLLRRSEAAEKTAVKMSVNRLDRNEMGEFLVSALACELNPDLGIVVPKFPVSAREVLENMDGVVEAPDPIWKGRSMQYKVPHPGIVFHGVVNAKYEAVKAADRIIQSGWADGLGDDFERAWAKVRAGQILVDFLHFLEGKNDREFRLGSVWVAEDLIRNLCFATAAEQGVTLKGLRVRPSAQFAYDELAENLGGSIAVNALEGAVEYRYDLRSCCPQSIISTVRAMVLMAEGEGGRLADEVRERLGRFADFFADLPEGEKRLVLYSAADVLDDLQAVVDMEKAQAVLAGGNGRPAVAASDAVASEVAVEVA